MRRMTRTWIGAAAAALLAPIGLRAQDAAREKEQARETELKSLQERLEALEAKTKGLPEAAGKDLPVGTYFKDGFRFRSADGNFEGHIGGRIMEHLRFINGRRDSGGLQPANTFTFKENYLQLDGTFYKQYEYKVQANFFPNATNAGPFASLSDCYLGWKASPAFGLRFGQMEVPLSQEEICSTLFIDFVERSVLNRLSPVRDLGAQAYGALGEGVFEYEAGFFNGNQIGSNTRNLNDNNDEKDFAVRLRVTPFKTSDDRRLNRLRLGVAATTGLEGGSPPASSDSLPALSSVETGTTYVFYPAGAVNDGDRRRLGAELSWAVSGFGLRAEYLRSRLDAALGAAKETLAMDAYYVTATCLLTGEDKAPDGRIVPDHPFDLSSGDWGAFELAVRLAGLDAGDLSDKGFIDPAKGGNDGVTAVTLGVNWWPTRNVRCSLNWVRNDFDKDLVSGGNKLDAESAVLMRWQIDF